MGKFNKTGKRGMPALNTSSLPDLIFTLLFFFMMVTTMSEVELKVRFQVPAGTELAKLEKKSLVTFIYIGQPTDLSSGTASRVQINDSFVSQEGDVRDFVNEERAKMNEEDKPLMQVSLKIDGDTKMGIVSDVKKELRQASALKINYSARNRGE